MKPNLIPPLDTQGRPIQFIAARRRPTLAPVPARPTLAISRAFIAARERERLEDEWPELPPEPFSLLAWINTPRRNRVLACVVVVAFALFVGFQAGRVVGCECREVSIAR